MATDNNDFTHEFQIYSTDLNAGTMGTGKFLLFDNNINAVKVEDVSNIKIGGGSNGRVLATDGEGNLYWMSAAAVSGGVSNYNDLNDLPNLSVYAQTADLATVATTGSYNDLTNKPSLFGGNYSDLTNKPTLVTSYNQLTDKPTIPTVPTDVSAFTNDAGYLTSVTNITGNAATVSNGVYTTGTYANPAWITSLAYSKLTDAPDLSTVATSGSYADLTNKPSLATVATTGSYSDLTNRPTIFSGDYADLANKPVLFDGAYLSLTGLPNLAAVATSGSYDDLSNKPSIPAAQVNADWNETISESPAYIFNKPSIPDLTGYATEAWVQSQGYGAGGASVTSYNDLTDKPTIPSSLSDLGITAGSNGQVLTLNSSLVPVWATPSSGGQTFDQSLNTDDIVTFDLLTVTDSAGIKNFNGERISNTYVNGTMYVGANTTQTPVSILMGGAGPRNEWAFTPDGKLTFPRNQDQVTTTDPILTIKGGEFPEIASTASDSMGPADLAIVVNNLNISGYNGAKVIIHADDGSITADNDLVLKSNNTVSANTWAFKADGSFAINNNEVHIATNNWGISATANATTVVYTAKQQNLASIRVHATIEGNEDSDVTGLHSQACDMMIVRRVAIGGAVTVDSVVYGVIYTGAGPLATLDAQWNATTNRIEITATPTSTTNNVYVKIYATEVARGD